MSQNYEFARTSGVLLHITSLPGRFGSGDLGHEAYQFVDSLAAAEQRLWQVLPLSPTGYGNCPYSSFSAFAGNHFLISPEKLVEHKLLTREDLQDVPPFPTDHVDFGWIIYYRMNLLRVAFENFKALGPRTKARTEYKQFVKDNAYWLDDYALFMALKNKYDGRSWSEWSHDDQVCAPTVRAHHEAELHDVIDFHKFLQFEFDRQWHALREYANSKNVKIVGDIPIFVGYDSADVWGGKQNFQLDDQFKPTVVAGCPPDQFAATGQRWGNPHYRWDAMKDGGFDWWIKRFEKCFELYDIVRIDHFRGFEAYWEIPGTDPTAEFGKWVNPPGMELFQTLREKFGPAAVIAEDLGTITPEVTALRRAFGFPGMKILQFGFESCNPSDSFLPWNFENDCVVYTGTHDNDTTLGWYRAVPDHVRAFVQQSTHTDSETENVWQMIRLGMDSCATICITPLQDLLVLGTEARMNFPGKADHQWEFRFRSEQLTEATLQRLAQLTRDSHRTGH